MQRSSIYEQVQREQLEGRHLEASVLFNGARKLTRCARDWENRQTTEFQEKLTEALEFNQRMWSFLQVELSSPANPLSETLRLNLLRLSKFIDKRIFNVFAGRGTAEDLLSVARINEQIAKGLQASASFTDEAEQDESVPVELLDIAG